MQDATSRLKRAQETARTARKLGDALRRTAAPEADIVEAYEEGVDALEQAVDSVADERARLDAMSPPLSGEAAALLHELVESCGALGGLRQRMGRPDALDSYAVGAALERKFGLASTYNRLNALKQRLLTRQDATLRAMEPEIATLAATIETALRADQMLSNSGWAWADLGDCLALLGGRDEEAAHAYATFIARAEIKSPERTLDVLRQIAAKLKERQDPDASRLQTAIDVLQGRLSARQ